MSNARTGRAVSWGNLEDGHTDECAGMIEAHFYPKGFKRGNLMMDEAFISSDILEPLICPVTVYALQGDFVLLHFCRKAEFDLLLSMMSSVLSSQQLVFRSVIKCSLSHTSSCFTHLSYLNSRGLQICMKL